VDASLTERPILLSQASIGTSAHLPARSLNSDAHDAAQQLRLRYVGRRGQLARRIRAVRPALRIQDPDWSSAGATVTRSRKPFTQSIALPSLQWPARRKL